MEERKNSNDHLFNQLINFYFLKFEIEGWQAIVKAQEAVDHLTSFSSSKEEILESGIEPPTSSLRFGNLSTILR